MRGDTKALQQAKAVVRGFHAALDAAPPEAAAEVCARHHAPGALWRGYHPFGEIAEPAEVGAQFWRPLRQALRPIQRRLDVFIAGRNRMDGGAGIWVASMGHLMGLLDAPWLGIPPTGRIAMLRFCEFARVEGDRIAETAFFFDIPHLMMQAGLNPFPPQTGAHLVQPGPAPHDGLCLAPQDPAEGARTMAAIEAMITDLGQWNLGLPLEAELARSWHDDMIWWGPAGIGATYTIARYARQHSGPFRRGLADRSPTTHIARIAEGHYGGFFGWPNFTARPVGGFMGLGAFHEPVEFRVIDIYRRQGDKLAENWVFIDLLHVLAQMGMDVLARMQELREW
ncbi:MAG: nuclear transport factor 2 family protein [Alphaproteobacteria bacterium]|nr:MAG: nuclear transport factor 2 family protein [Alphaproteobacteria bacterium]